MSAQSPSPSVPSQPPKSAAYSSSSSEGKPPSNQITRNLSEFAVSDSPAPEGEGEQGARVTHRTANDVSDSNPNPAPLERGIRRTTGSEQQQQNENMTEGGGGGGGGYYEATEVGGEGRGEKMAPPTEGKVAAAVEESNAQARSSRRSDDSQQQHDHSRGKVRERGEVSLGEEEGGLERKKAQQEVMRKQVMDARARGEDVDGRREHELRDVTGEGRREQINLV